MNNYFTVVVWKKDGRVSEKRGGKRFIESTDYKGRPKSHVRGCAEMEYPSDKGYIVEIFDTYVTRRNVITGKLFQERYDTPYFCSPSSETYWSM